MKNIKIKSSRNVIPSIYAYTTPTILDNIGYTKIGYTERDVETRIKEQTQTAHARYQIEWKDLALFNDGTRFTDKEFHSFLENKKHIERMLPQSGDKGKPEWFKISGEESHKLYYEFRDTKGILKH